MKKLVSFFLVLMVCATAIPVLDVNAAGIENGTSDIVYSDHLTDNNKEGYDYDITDSVIAWVKQATGVLVWVSASDTRSDNEIIDQAKNADPSLGNAVKKFDVLKGEGTKNTPNTNGSQAVITVYTDENGKMIMHINGAYSHFVKGVSANNNQPTEPVTPPASEDGETVNIRIDTPKKMAVKFEDGTVYYGGEMKEVVVGEEYIFQMCSVNWENGIYDESGNGICGTVVYRMKVVHEKEFIELRKEAMKDPSRYTVKGMDIIDNDSKTIIINCDAENFHLETDVNNFFVAYRFHFENGDYNKQTGIKNVVNTPLESLSVNLPLGTTVRCDAYKGYQNIDNDDVFITRNNGEGKYADVYLSSVNDYYWKH